jgi:hypothetical protein
VTVLARPYDGEGELPPSMTATTYPENAADAIGAELKKRGSPLPSATLRELVEALFFTSLLTEEGRHVGFHVVFHGANLPIEEGEWGRWTIVRFEVARALTPDGLVKLAALATKDGQHLVIQSMEKGLEIIGIATATPFGMFSSKHAALTVHVDRPGSLRFFFGDNELPAYQAGRLHTPEPWPFDSPSKIPALAARLRERGSHECDIAPLTSFVLRSLLTALVGTGHGGIIAFVGENQLDELVPARSRLLERIDLYEKAMEAAENRRAREAQAAPSQAATIETMRAYNTREEAERAAQRELLRRIRLVGSLTTLDGAVIVTHGLEAVGFGVQLKGSQPSSVLRRRNGVLERWDMHGMGTRHHSVAQFVGDSSERLAFIASADGACHAVYQQKGAVVFWPVRDRYAWFLG